MSGHHQPVNAFIVIELIDIVVVIEFVKICYLIVIAISTGICYLIVIAISTGISVNFIFVLFYCFKWLLLHLWIIVALRSSSSSLSLVNGR